MTGSTRGIGFAIAEGMGRAHARVVVSSEDPAAVSATVATLQADAIDVHGVVCDVGDDEELDHLVKSTLAAFGGIDVLVCNAGIAGRPGPTTSNAWDDYDRVMTVNLRSVVRLTGLALPHIAERGGGSIILMSSISALRGNGTIGTYALTKAALAQLARNLAVQWGPRGVRVNAISPGLIRTEFPARSSMTERSTNAGWP